MAEREEVLDSLRVVQELERFAHEFIDGLTREELRDGEAVLPYAERMGVRVPNFLVGEEVTWTTHDAQGDDVAGDNALVLVRPGHFQALGIKLGCIRWRRVTICLECGWIWCRIVIRW